MGDIVVVQQAFEAQSKDQTANFVAELSEFCWSVFSVVERSAIAASATTPDLASRACAQLLWESQLGFCPAIPAAAGFSVAWFSARSVFSRHVTRGPQKRHDCVHPET